MFPLLLQSMRVTDFQKRGATALQNGSINIYKRWSATCWGAPTFSPVFIGILGSLPPRRSRVTQRERESRSIQGNHNSIVLIHFPSILLLGGNFTFFFSSLSLKRELSISTCECLIIAPVCDFRSESRFHISPRRMSFPFLHPSS